MVEWCKNCGAFLGLVPPVRNWKVERNRLLCARCAEREIRRNSKNCEETTVSARGRKP